MSDTGHDTEVLQDLLDRRLTPDAEADVRAHLRACASCRATLALLESGRSAGGLLRADRELPADLTASVRASLDRIDQEARSGPARRIEPAGAAVGRRPSTSRWVFGGAVAATVVLVAALWWTRAQPGPPAIAAQHFASVVGGRTPLAILSADPAELERRFVAAGTPRVRVFDLAMMGFTLEGGIRGSFGSRPSALYVYHNAAGDRLVCEMYEGTAADLPATDDVREKNGFRFHVFREGDVTAVFWQEGDILCVLTSRLPTQVVVDLAFAKAMRAA